MQTFFAWQDHKQINNQSDLVFFSRQTPRPVQQRASVPQLPRIHHDDQYEQWALHEQRLSLASHSQNGECYLFPLQPSYRTKVTVFTQKTNNVQLTLWRWWPIGSVCVTNVVTHIWVLFGGVFLIWSIRSTVENEDKKYLWFGRLLWNESEHRS